MYDKNDILSIITENAHGPMKQENTMSEYQCLGCDKRVPEVIAMIALDIRPEALPTIFRASTKPGICDECTERMVHLVHESILSVRETKRKELEDETKELSDKIDRLAERAQVFAGLLKEKDPTSTAPVK